MKLIEHEAHFWELYKEAEQYYLSIAVDMSSVVSCWDLVLTRDEIFSYKQQGRESLENLAKSIVDGVYRGDFSLIDSRLAEEKERKAIQLAFKQWQRQPSS